MKLMNKLINLSVFVIVGIFLIFASNNICAQQKQHKHKNKQVFVDKNGDGYNDMAPDHDGDGIPNGLDPDWTKGRGRKLNYIDADGDGINDLIQINNQTDFENVNMHQNGSRESIMNSDQEIQKGHKRGKGNKQLFGFVR